MHRHDNPPLLIAAALLGTGRPKLRHAIALSIQADYLSLADGRRVDVRTSEV
jgi:hypothetical protein